MKFRRASSEDQWSYLYGAGYNDQKTGREVQKFLPWSKLANISQNIVKMLIRLSRHPMKKYRTFRGFFLTFDMDKLEKIHQFRWKERIKFSKIAKFESGLWKTNEDMPPQVATFYRRLYGGGHKLFLPSYPTIQTFVNFRNFAVLYLRSLKTYHHESGQFAYFKELFPMVSTDFPLFDHVKI